MTTFEERLVIDNKTKGNVIHNEHVVRYQFVSEMVAGKTVLDIACGSGYGAGMMAEAGAARVIAMDIDTVAIEGAKKNFGHRNIEFMTGDATQIGLKEKTIDIVVSFETIEHLENVASYLSELVRIMKDDGLAFISTPNKAVSGAKNPFHFQEFTGNEFESLLKKYFPHCFVVPQFNAVASFLAVNKSKDVRLEMTSQAEPVFFLAVCSKKEIPLRQLADCAKNRASLNPAALNNLYNNPGLKLADKVYSALVKVPGIKNLFQKIK